MPKIESKKIDCLYRKCSRLAPRGKIESIRTHSEVIEQFDSFSMLKLLFLVRSWHCWSRKAFPRQMIPQSREKLRKRSFFDTADRHEKLCGRSRLYASAQGRHETGGVLSLFSRLSFDISIQNSVQSWSSDFQGLFRIKIRKMAQGSDDLSTLPLSYIKQTEQLFWPHTQLDAEGKRVDSTHFAQYHRALPYHFLELLRILPSICPMRFWLIACQLQVSRRNPEGITNQSSSNANCLNFS